MFLVANLDLEFGHPPLHLQKLHVQGGLFTPECSHLLLNARVLSLLESVVAFHFLFDFEVFVCEGFPDLLCLEGKYTLERFLLGSEHLDLFLVIVELLSERFDHLLEGAYFTLNVGGVLYLRARG